MSSDQPLPDDLNRRGFVKLAVGTGVVSGLGLAVYSRYHIHKPYQAAASAENPAGQKAVIDEYDDKNIKLAHRVPSSLTDDDILYLKQIGLRWMRVELRPEEAQLDELAKVQKRFEAQGIKIYSAMHPAYRSLKIQLGQKDRDADIDIYRTFLKSCGKLGIPLANYDFHPGNTYTTATVERRGYKAREFKLDDFRQKVEKQRFDREYTADEIWDHYTYFVMAVLPVAEEAGVKLGLHPDDPPLAKMNGVAKLFIHRDGYRKAEEIARGSKHWGLTFCIGTWAEGGQQMGKDVFGMIEDFGGRGKIFDVHFRNVSGPLPHFVETFPDDGYLDLASVMKALRKVGFNGAMVPDHVPQLAGDTGIRRAGTAYCIACMRSYLRRANEEVG